MESPSLKALRLLAADPSVDPALREIFGELTGKQPTLRDCGWCGGTGWQTTTYAYGADDRYPCRHCHGRGSVLAARERT